MGPLCVVEMQIFRKSFPVGLQCFGNSIETFFLESSVESLKMAVLGRTAHVGVAVLNVMSDELL